MIFSTGWTKGEDSFIIPVIFSTDIATETVTPVFDSTANTDTVQGKANVTNSLSLKAEVDEEEIPLCNEQFLKETIAWWYVCAIRMRLLIVEA